MRTLDVVATLKAGTALPEKELLKHIDAIVGALRNPELYGDVMADVYQIARTNNLTIEGGLLHLARKEGLTIKAIPNQKGILEGGTFFDDYVKQRVSIHDLPFKADPNAPLPVEYHGSVIHIVQDIVVNRARVGGRATASASSSAKRTARSRSRTWTESVKRSRSATTCGGTRTTSSRAATCQCPR